MYEEKGEEVGKRVALGEWSGVVIEGSCTGTGGLLVDRERGTDLKQTIEMPENFAWIFGATQL